MIQAAGPGGALALALRLHSVRVVRTRTGATRSGTLFAPALASLASGYAIGDDLRAALRAVGTAAGGAVAAVATNLIVLAGSVGFGVAMARVAGLSTPAVVLATAPGGLPEASITAKVLDLGVPFVAAFHLVRLVLIVLLAAPIFRGTRALWRARGS